MEITEKTIDTKEIFQGKVIKVRVDKVELTNGKKATREIVEHSGGVVIIPNKEGKVILVEQFRKPVDKCLLELPAGKLEPGEEPLECARRELIEETGYIPGQLKPLFSFYTTPGFSDEILHLFIADDLEKGEISPDEDEIIRNHEIDKEEIIEFFHMGKIEDGKTIIGLLAYLRGDIHE